MFQPPQNKKRFTLLENLTSVPRLRLLSLILLGIWVIVYLNYHISSKSLVNEKGVVIGSDFITFYLAGTIIKEKGGERIYNPDYQKQVQDQILAPDKMEGLLFFINPPWVAVIYSVYAYLPYRLAFHLHTMTMVFCFIGGVWALRPHLRAISSHWWIAGLLGMLWFPMIKTITGGQNAAMIFLLLCCGYSALIKNKSNWAGLSFGLLLFKPQYAFPIIGLLALRKKWKILAVVISIGGIQYFLGAYFCGFAWPFKMLNAINDSYRIHERMASGATHISILEAIDYSLIRPLHQFTTNEQIIKFVHFFGYLLVGSGIVTLAVIWRKVEFQRDDFGLFWAFTIAAILLISLHTQYYDASLLFLSVILILDYQLFKGYPITSIQRMLLFIPFFLFPLYHISEIIHFQPLIILPTYICWWAIKLIRSENRFTPMVRKIK